MEKLTSAEMTPGSAASILFRRAEQPAQVMPVI